MSVRGTGTCFAVRFSAVVFGADIFGRARAVFDATAGDLGEMGLSGRSSCENEPNFEGEVGLPGFALRNADKKSMLGERTDSASLKAPVKPSVENTESRTSSESAVVDDSVVSDVSMEVEVSTVVNVSTLGRTALCSPGIGVAFRESGLRGVFARLNFS